MKTRIIVFVGLFISMQIILDRFFVIDTGIFRMGFGFIPLAFSSIMFGPAVGGLTGALADVVGYALSGKGTFFPGFTLSGAITGALYGFFLYRKPKTFARFLIPVTIITVFVNLGLNTLWLTILYNKSAAAIIYPRILAESIMFVVRIVMLNLVWKYIGSYVESNIYRKAS